MSDLYQQAVLRAAADAVGAGPLPQAQRQAMLHNPLCGDRIAVTLRLDAADRVAAMGHETRACLLCQAAASVLAASIAGRDSADLAALPAGLEGALKGEAWPADWPGFEIFTPVRQASSRHTCVLLPARAVAQALQA